jgi:hypothetical protein
MTENKFQQTESFQDDDDFVVGNCDGNVDQGEK